ncbi:MAG: polyprenol monophosphomannose synthase [Actinomycetota bacterium]|nr:polyprenol monophosphomannose synthase [Actinomycetota bacterium]
MICGVRLAICLPTYNERESLEPIVRALDAVFAANGLDGRVLVLDDASPDGTGELADRLAAELPWLDVLHRPRKGGLGPAYLAGFEHVLAEGAELVMEMDCDFSHDPADVPRLVAATADADLVIGSRYVAGGGVRNWGPLRRAVSRSGCLYAQAVLALPVRDATAGFRCFRRRVLEAIGLERVTSRGYAFQVETTYRAVRAGFRVVEVPIVFAERKAGSSKMTRGIVAEAVVKVPALRIAAALGRL